MGRCCGGKNAGKPIPAWRYLLGLGAFAGYHTVLQAALALASTRVTRLQPLVGFHRDYARGLWRELRAKEGVRVEGWR